MIGALAACRAARTDRPASVDAFSFAAFGDAPYFEGTAVHAYEAMRDAIDAARPAFAVHLGDFKSGSSRCSDALFAQRHALLTSMRTPLVLTPGDNDWADCHRGGDDPLERLQALRRGFFAPGATHLPVGTLRQSDQADMAPYVEHLRWEHGGVVFCSVHLVASENGRMPFGENAPRRRDARDDAEADARSAAAIAWMRAAFARARAGDAAGLVLFMHATPDLKHRLPTASDAWRGFMPAFGEEASRFGKPILIVQGDLHLHRVDRPLAGAPYHLPQVLRLVVDGAPFTRWTEVHVDRHQPERFRIERGSTLL